MKEKYTRLRFGGDWKKAEEIGRDQKKSEEIRRDLEEIKISEHVAIIFLIHK